METDSPVLTKEMSPLLEPNFDTIIVPAREDGFQRVFMGRHEWPRLRLSSESRCRLKWIAVYRTAPLSAVTHYAQVVEFVPEDSEHWTAKITDPREVEPIPLVRDGSAPNVQTPRFTRLDRLLKATCLNPLLVRK